MQGSRDDIREFNEGLVDRYFNGESPAAIAEATGRSISTIQKLVAAEKHINPDRKRSKAARDPRALLEKRIISPRHSWIGLVIARYRAEHDMTPTQFGMLVPTTRMVVRNMEIGAHDFTIREVERLSEILGSPFEELISGGRHRKQ